MKASQFSDAQKAFIWKQGRVGVPVADIFRKAGDSNLKKKYDDAIALPGPDVAAMRSQSACGGFY
jgi:hypothetical protein